MVISRQEAPTLPPRSSHETGKFAAARSVLSAARARQLREESLSGAAAAAKEPGRAAVEGVVDLEQLPDRADTA